MSAMTDYFESGVLNQVFRGIAFSFPSTGIYVGLTSDSPSEGSPDANEISGNKQKYKYD